MGFPDRIKRKKSKDEVFQGKSKDQERQTTKIEKRINELVRCETCGTGFSSPQDFERHAGEDHPDMPAKPRRG
jgi:uncharacterized C2H2 Zn-finger protein